MKTNPFKHRRLVKQHHDFATYRWVKDEPVQLSVPIISELRPVEIHMIPEGSENGGPTFLMVLETNMNTFVLCEFDLDMIWPAMEVGIREVRT